MEPGAAVGLVTLATGALFAGGGLLLHLTGLLPLSEILDLFLVGALCGGVTSAVVALTE